MPKPGVRPLVYLAAVRQQDAGVGLWSSNCSTVPGLPATGVPWAGVALCQGCLGPLGGVRPPPHCGVVQPRAVWEPDLNVP